MTTAKPAAIEPVAIETGVTLPYRLVLNVRALEMTEDQLLQLCSDNGDLRIELTANRELVIMPPAGLESGWQEVELARQVGNWAVQNGTGRFLVRMLDTPYPTAQCALPMFHGCPCLAGSR